MIQYFPEPNEHSHGNLKVELDLTKNATKTKLKEVTEIDTSIMDKIFETNSSFHVK